MKEITITQHVTAINEKPTKVRVQIILILFVILFVAYLDRVNISILVADDTFVMDMGIEGNAVAKGALMSLFLATYAIANVVFAPLGDWLGPRKVMALAILLWTISCIWGGLVTTFTGMIVARIILGIGEGMHWPMQMKFVKNWFPPNERARANSVWLVGLTAGVAVAMPFFAWIVGAFGWRESFYALTVIGVIPMILIWFYTTDHPREHKKINQLELEYIENGLKAERLILPQQEPKKSLWENWRGFLYNVDYWLCVIFYIFTTATWFGLMTWIPSYLREALGFSWQSMGFWANVPYAAGVLACLSAGYLTDKIPRKSTLGIFHMLGGALGIYFAAHASAQVEAALWLVVAVASLMIGLPGHWAIIQKAIPAGAMGAGVGLESALGSGAGAITPLIIGYFIDTTGGFTGGLMCLVTFCFIGMLAMLILWFRKV